MTRIIDDGELYGGYGERPESMQEATQQTLTGFSEKFPNAKVTSFSVRWDDDDDIYKFRIQAEQP